VNRRRRRDSYYAPPRYARSHAHTRPTAPLTTGERIGIVVGVVIAALLILSWIR
jgi:hypothetical protein